jgi:23S rRNA (uracil1939-C5)-methyltransferase
MTQKNKQDTYSLTIEKLVYKGLGLGTHDGFKVFIPNVVPGDIIQFQYTKLKRTFGEGKCISIQTPSLKRIAPACSHYPSCGGCQLMDIDYPTQLEFKAEMLKDAISQFHPDLLPVSPAIVASPVHHYYRNKMEFSFGEAEGSIRLGLKKRGSFKDIVSIKSCLLQSETSNQLVKHMETFFNEHPLPVWNSREQTGILRYITIRESKAFNTQMLILSVSSKNKLLLKKLTTSLEAFPSVTSFFIREIKEEKGSPTTHAYHHIFGEQFLQEKLGDYTFQISPDSFFQTNTTQAVTLYNAVKKALPTSKALLDLYCGTGTIGIYCSSTTDSLIGIEEIENAIINARKNAEINNVSHGDFKVGRVKNILKFEKIDCDAIIVDPPRSGMTPKALKRMLALNVETIVYVSCNPTTLLRDLKIAAEENYSVKTFEAFDMFPHTYHMECVVQLCKS